MIHIEGFHEPKELTQFEKVIGSKIIDLDSDAFSAFRDDYVQINIGSGNYCGVYKGITASNFAILCPFLGHMTLPT